MKKGMILLCLALLLLTLGGCGEEPVEQGVSIVNQLGVDLTTVDLQNEDMGGTTLHIGIPNGDAATAFMYYEEREGNVSLTATDAEGNTYSFPQIYLHDGVELWLEWMNGVPYARHEYGDSYWEHEGTFLPADNQGDELKGTWTHTATGHTIEFDGVDSFRWHNAQGIINGSYSFDGFTLTLRYDGKSMELYLMDDGKLIAAGEDGEFYGKGE